MKILKYFAFATWLIGSALQAQNADPLVFTVGNSYSTGTGKSHNYVLWQPGDVSTTFGKRFAVYGKDGPANSGQPFARLGIQTVQTSPSAIQALLLLGAKVDYDKDALPRRVTALHSEALAQPLTDESLIPTSITREVAQKLAQILETAKTDPEILQSLISLGRAHPGVLISMGHGFAIEVPSTSIKTYEIREIGEANSDLRVVGRVTLDASSPTQLPPPGRPFPNPHPVDPDLQLVASAKDHLNVRLRWGMLNDLREALPKTYGFNLYRVPVGFGDPASLTTESELFEKPGAARVNDLPIAASDLFTDAEAADLSVKRDVFFYADDNDPPDEPFVDGETFFYYVTARDIAGHPGPLSLPTEITMCDRLPPSQPAILSVDNVFDFDSVDLANQTGDQHLRVVIRQVPEMPKENRATSYRVYRWHSATDWQRHGGDPEFNFIGEVAHVEGAATVTFDDNDASDKDLDYENPNKNGPDTGAAIASDEGDFNMGKTFWYTVRSVDSASCDPPNMSGHSGAHYGVIRDRVGPAKPSGSIAHCFCEPLVEFETHFSRPFSDYGVDDEFPGAVVRVNRTDPNNRNVVYRKIRSFEVQIARKQDGNEPIEVLYSRTCYYKGASPFADVVIPVPQKRDLLVRVKIRLDDRTETFFLPKDYDGEGDPEGLIRVYEFNGLVDGVCRPVIEMENQTAIAHYPFGLLGSMTGISGTVEITEGTREVRVYRRVGRTSPLQLIFKTGGDDLDDEVEWAETGPVITNGVEVCYFAQVFDEHGNASPLVRIACVTIVNDDFGIPLVTEPEPYPPFGGQGIIRLSWFCDPVGVDRFEVWIASETGGEPEFGSTELGAKLDTGGPSVLDTDDGSERTFCIYQTPSIASGFGSGAEFQVELQVPYGRKYFYAIRPVGEMVSGASGQFSRAEGSFSNIVCSSYSEPSEPDQPVVPWPARPLPGTANIEQKIANFTRTEGPFYATALTPETMKDQGCSGAILVGAFPSQTRGQNGARDKALAPDDVDPLNWLFHYREQVEGPATTQTKSIARFVVYRHQVSSARFPDARPNLVQITPLIDRLAYIDDKESGAFHLVDPFFVFKRFDDDVTNDFQVPAFGTFSRDNTSFGLNTAEFVQSTSDYLSFPPRFDDPREYFGQTMWVRDTMPVTRGASYQYLIVHFTPRGEIARVIPTNIISH